MTKQIKNFEFVNLRIFKGKHEMFFKKGINVISGPNGGGKSSIIVVGVRRLSCIVGEDIKSEPYEAGCPLG